MAGVAAPSANRFGRLSPTQAAHVLAELGDEPGLRVLDGGACEVGIESTIVDCSRGQPVLLRPGRLTRQAIEAVLGKSLGDRDAAAPRAPGTLESHYAPRACVRLMSEDELRAGLDVLGRVSAVAPSGAPPRVAVYSRHRFSGHAAAIFQAMPVDAAAAAHELFSVLRHFDGQGVGLIWVETPPEDPEWDGIKDRLTRAAAA